MGLEDNDMDVVIDAMDERNAKAGENVIIEGENGYELYVVEEGQLDCFKKFVKTPFKVTSLARCWATQILEDFRARWRFRWARSPL